MKQTPFLVNMLRVIHASPRLNATNLAHIIYEGNRKLDAVKNQGNGASRGLNLNRTVSCYRAKVERAGLIRERHSSDYRATREWYLTDSGKKMIEEYEAEVVRIADLFDQKEEETRSYFSDVPNLTPGAHIAGNLLRMDHIWNTVVLPACSKSGIDDGEVRALCGERRGVRSE